MILVKNNRSIRHRRAFLPTCYEEHNSFWQGGLPCRQTNRPRTATHNCPSHSLLAPIPITPIFNHCISSAKVAQMRGFELWERDSLSGARRNLRKSSFGFLIGVLSIRSWLYSSVSRKSPVNCYNLLQSGAAQWQWLIDICYLLDKSKQLARLDEAPKGEDRVWGYMKMGHLIAKL